MGAPYTKEEDEIILQNLRDVARKFHGRHAHKMVLKCCYEISATYLPHRTPEAIRERWNRITCKVVYLPVWFQCVLANGNKR